MTSRRHILFATAATLALAACSTSGTTTVTQLQTTSALVTAGVAAVAASVLATPNLATDTATKINAAVNTVSAANQVIQQATATTDTNAQQLVAGVRLAAPMLLALLDPESAQAVAINAALALLPTILAAAGVPPTAAMAHAVKMTPVQATAVLKAYTGK